MFGILALCIALILLLGFDNRLRVETYRLHAETRGEILRFAVIADLHNATYAPNQRPLIDAVVQSQPDAIFIVGDIVDSASSMEGMHLLLDALRSVAPMYYVSGNHEYWSGHVADIKKAVAAYGAQVLSDEFTRVKIKGVSLIIAGIEDEARQTHFDSLYDQQKSMRRAFKLLEGERACKILLSHRPLSAFPFDLVVSGHVHGGHVRIPFTNIGVMGPNGKLFPRYCSGQYTIGTQTLIISRGLSLKRAIIPRFYNPPELSVIEISSQY